jgi:peptide/nickel transport system ATP-binding protein
MTDPSLASRKAGPLLDVRGLTKMFPMRGGLLAPKRAGIRAVHEVSFAVGRGEVLGLVGESGSGKSTIGRCVLRLVEPSVGEVVFDGTDVTKLSRSELKRFRRRMQIVFQDPYASLNPRWRVRDIVAEPMKVLQLKGDVAQLLLQVGLSPEDGAKYPHEFSGGQRQRISIARALSGEPDLLVCDEPTSALDVSVQAQILNLMTDLQRRLGLTYVFISHNLAVVSQVAERVGVMYLGRLVELAAAGELFARPRHPYTRMLLDAVPDLGLSGKPRTPVAGEVPNPLEPPTGCTFHPRCPHANERCRREVPAVINDVACHAVEEGRI